MNETVFARLCDLTDDLQRLASQVQPDAVQDAILHLVDRLDALIDETICFVPVQMPDDDDTPCPHCGEAACERACTGTSVADAGEGEEA